MNDGSIYSLVSFGHSRPELPHFVTSLSLSLTVLEVYQFARDAAVAEAWILAQEPYLFSQELGVRKIT